MLYTLPGTLGEEPNGVRLTQKKIAKSDANAVIKMFIVSSAKLFKIPRIRTGESFVAFALLCFVSGRADRMWNKWLHSTRWYGNDKRDRKMTVTTAET